MVQGTLIKADLDYYRRCSRCKGSGIFSCALALPGTQGSVFLYGDGGRQPLTEDEDCVIVRPPARRDLACPECGGTGLFQSFMGCERPPWWFGPFVMRVRELYEVRGFTIAPFICHWIWREERRCTPMVIGGRSLGRFDPIEKATMVMSSQDSVLKEQVSVVHELTHLATGLPGNWAVQHSPLFCQEVLWVCRAVGIPETAIAEYASLEMARAG